jgi:uncharacterized protein
VLREVEVVAGKENEAAKFRDYFAYSEAILAIPSHRALALLRGRNEGMLQLALVLDSELEQDKASASNPCEARIAGRFGIVDQGRPADKWLADTVRWSWRIKVSLHLELELMNALRERAEAEAIRVFGANLHDLLLAAPAGKHATMGLDPGLRTGVKVAVVDATGKLLETATVYPHEPRRDWDGALHSWPCWPQAPGRPDQHRQRHRLARNRSPGRRSDWPAPRSAPAQDRRFRGRRFGLFGLRIRLARIPGRRRQPARRGVDRPPPAGPARRTGQDRPQVDRRRPVPARRQPDPAGESAQRRRRGLRQCRRRRRQHRLGAAADARLRTERDAGGEHRRPPRPARRLSPTGRRSAKFRASATRPSSWPPASCASTTATIRSTVRRYTRKPTRSSSAFSPTSKRESASHRRQPPAQGAVPEKYTDDKFGLPTVRDILRELEKPGRDPRPEFKTAAFREGVEAVKDLQPGMILEGVVTNVANFGAFVDIGVHQDGLVHISAIANKFVKDPRSVVKAGDVVKVKVLEVDLPRQRIALSMRLADDLPGSAKMAQLDTGASSARARQRQQSQPAPGGAMASAFARLKR